MSVIFNVFLPGATHASNYISICDKAVGDAEFLYNHLVKNNIVPEHWYTPEELSISFSASSCRYIVYRRKPKKELMTIRMFSSFAAKRKKSIYDDPFADAISFKRIKFIPLNRIESPMWMEQPLVQSLDEPLPIIEKVQEGSRTAPIVDDSILHEDIDGDQWLPNQ